MTDASATGASEAPAEAPLVDAHAHVYTRDMPLAGTAWHAPTEDATIERYLATLDAHGVVFGVLAAASIYGDYNDYQIEAVRRHKRLRATIIARPGMDRRTLEQMKADGVVGIRLQWRNVASVPDLTSPEWRLLLRRVADLDWHVHIHDDAPRLAQPLAALHDAGVKIVVDHLGRPDAVRGLDSDGFQAILRSVERGHTWVKLSAGFRQASPEMARSCAQALLRSAGAERLMWGSDWPFAAFESSMNYERAIADLTDWVPDAAQRRRIAGETALRFYFT